MSDNIQEAEVGSGTKVADTKQSEKRAQITLKAIQLRLKQEKERAALQAQKKSLSVKEDIGESFSPSQIAALKAEYSKINGIDPASDTYKKLIAMLDRLDLKTLQSLAGAEIKFVSKLAQNRVLRKNMKKEDVQLDELSTNKLADYKKKAGENASAADKAGDTKTGNKRFSGIMKATRKQFDNDAKQKTEELSPKQKAMDKNKNGKIDGSDLAKLRGEELSPKQKELDKNKNGKIDGSDLAHLRDKKKPQGADFAAQRRKERMASNGRMDEAKSDYEVYHKDYSTAVQTAIKQAEKRGYEVDMDDWHDKVATGPKKPSSGKTNSFSINLMKDGKASKKKLQMQVYNMDNHKYELNMYIEEVEIAEAGPGLWANIHAKRQRIKNGSNERMKKPGEKGAPEAGALDRARGKNEAASPAQQAAIAIAMKKDGKEPKDRLPKKPADEYDRKVVKYLKKKHGMSEADARVPRQPGQPANSKAHSDLYTDENPKDTIQGLKFATVEDAESSVSKIRNSDRTSAHKVQAAVAMEQRAKAAGKDSAAAVYRTYINSVSKKETYEGVVDKIKAIKRGMQVKAKADDHFDKAGDPKNANASKDLKKAVRYHNLLNKEEVVLEAKKSKTFKNIKKKMKEEETPDKSTVKKGDALTGKREPIEINPELKEPAR